MMAVSRPVPSSSPSLQVQRKVSTSQMSAPVSNNSEGQKQTETVAVVKDTPKGILKTVASTQYALDKRFQPVMDSHATRHHQDESPKRSHAGSNVSNVPISAETFDRLERLERLFEGDTARSGQNFMQQSTQHRNTDVQTSLQPRKQLRVNNGGNTTLQASFNSSLLPLSPQPPDSAPRAGYTGYNNQPYTGTGDGSGTYRRALHGASNINKQDRYSSE